MSDESGQLPVTPSEPVPVEEPVEQTDAEKAAAERAVESATERVEQAAVEPIKEAEKEVQEATATQKEATATLQERLDAIVEKEARRLSESSPLTLEQARGLASESVGHVLDRLHIAHGGANPSPPVAAAVQGAVSGAAGEAASQVVKERMGENESGEGGGGDNPESGPVPPSPEPDQAPAGQHWSGRKVRLPGLGR